MRWTVCTKRVRFKTAVLAFVEHSLDVNSANIAHTRGHVRWAAHQVELMIRRVPCVSEGWKTRGAIFVEIIVALVAPVGLSYAVQFATIARVCANNVDFGQGMIMREMVNRVPFWCYLRHPHLPFWRLNSKSGIGFLNITNRNLCKISNSLVALSIQI